MKNKTSKQGAFPVVLIILAVFVLVISFLVAFGYSFIKSKIINQASNKLTALQALGGGKIGSLLPSGWVGNTGGGAGEGTTGTSNSGDQNKELKECKKGTFYQSFEGKIAVIGKEKITIDGSQYEICCWEATSSKMADDESLQAMKNCSITNQGGDSMILFDKKNNKYTLVGATLIKDGKHCTYSFDENGAVEEKICQ